jgi:hypothetical protein
MLEKQTIAYLRLAHGSYNITIMLLMLYQGFLGVRIRGNRKAGETKPKIIRRHRKYGPYLVLLGIAGFFAGKTLVYIGHGHFFDNPLHYLNGLLISLLLLAAFFISKKIRSDASGWREPHFITGICIICLYFVQLFLGIGILF